MRDKRPFTARLAACVFILAFGAAAGSTSAAEERRDQARSLEGLKGVVAVVEIRSPEAETETVSPRSIAETVKRKLGEGGIQVFMENERKYDPRYPVLAVIIGAMNEYETYAVDLRLQLRQEVTLPNGRAATAATWEMESIGSVGASVLSSWINRILEESLAALAADWRAANPGK